MTEPTPPTQPEPAPVAPQAAQATPPTSVTPTPAAPAAPRPAQPGLKDYPKLPFALQEGEHVLLFARRHWAFLTIRLLKEGVYSLVPVAIILLILNWTVGLDGATGSIAIGAAVIWLLFWAVQAYFTWYRYQNEVWIVTNQRIVDSSRKHWFNHAMASADLDDVEDMKVSKNGIFPTMFGYGDVQLQTAGQVSNFVLAGVPDPTDVLALIDQQRDAAKKRLRGV